MVWACLYYAFSSRHNSTLYSVHYSKLLKHSGYEAGSGHKETSHVEPGCQSLSQGTIYVSNETRLTRCSFCIIKYATVYSSASQYEKNERLNTIYVKNVQHVRSMSVSLYGAPNQ